MTQPNKQIIDVERLVDELKERVAKERAAGAYGDELSAVDLEVLPQRDSTLAQGFDLTAGGPRVQFRPELGFSAKPVIGPVITLVKKFVIRLLFFVLDDLARQTDAAVTRLESALAAEAAARERTDKAESAAREGAESDIRTLSLRADRTEEGVEKLQLGPRLARLERQRRAPAEAAAPVAGDGASHPDPGAGIDYEAFEGRFRPEESVRQGQKEYVELLRGGQRVVDLGCGRGELIEMLRAEGIDAYGVEIDPDFIALLEEKGIEVIAQDAVEHLAGLESESLGGVVASHVVEHLPPAAVAALVSLAAEKIAPEGVLILETPNPESLVAGSINFHRDLTHVRPIHPDTLAFLAESAGFSEVEVRRLSPVPADERLPAPSDERLSEVVERLNDLLYGFQDYAVVARKQAG